MMMMVVVNGDDDDGHGDDGDIDGDDDDDGVRLQTHPLKLSPSTKLRLTPKQFFSPPPAAVSPGTGEAIVSIWICICLIVFFIQTRINQLLWKCVIFPFHHFPLVFYHLNLRLTHSVSHHHLNFTMQSYV